MAAQSMNLGQDATILLQGSDGSTISFNTAIGDLISYDLSEVTNLVSRKTISGTGSGSGYEINRVEHIGYKGSFEIGRINATFDQFSSQAAQNYHQGNDEVKYTINVSIQSRDGSGSVQEFAITNCSVWAESLGKYAMGEDVRQTFQFKGDDYPQFQ